jgi:hypothetical protein
MRQPLAISHSPSRDGQLRSSLGGGTLSIGERVCDARAPAFEDESSQEDRRERSIGGDDAGSAGAGHCSSRAPPPRREKAAPDGAVLGGL